mmetsp:Transcript_18493/g.51086  ORF Transcript_18493/g.51086 Transcript_18493/m.51086 type:complete len:413 (+) Transcript_18493:2363-3601(+)
MRIFNDFLAALARAINNDRLGILDRLLGFSILLRRRHVVRNKHINNLCVPVRSLVSIDLVSVGLVRRLGGNVDVRVLNLAALAAWRLRGGKEVLHRQMKHPAQRPLQVHPIHRTQHRKAEVAGYAKSILEECYDVGQAEAVLALAPALDVRVLPSGATVLERIPVLTTVFLSELLVILRPQALRHPWYTNRLGCMIEVLDKDHGPGSRFPEMRLVDTVEAAWFHRAFPSLEQRAQLARAFIVQAGAMPAVGLSAAKVDIFRIGGRRARESHRHAGIVGAVSKDVVERCARLVLPITKVRVRVENVGRVANFQFVARCRRRVVQRSLEGDLSRRPSHFNGAQRAFGLLRHTMQALAKEVNSKPTISAFIVPADHADRIRLDDEWAVGFEPSITIVQNFLSNAFLEHSKAGSCT